MHISTNKFDARAKEAIGNTQLQGGLFIIGKIFTAMRDHALAQMPEFEALRDQARDIKKHTLENLDTYLLQFEERVAENGGRVHWARDGDEANRIVAQLCREVEAKTVIKSKSMVTEELELNPALEEDGFTVTETDLGEYIIQLRHEKPFHIVAPAWHLSAAQVADTFFEEHKKFGRTERVEDKTKLVEEARIVLRERFKQADVGITGANFLIAETGSIALVTNEGNADLCATLPKRHIVVTGIEKLLPTLDDLALFWRVLPRSATGQETANYLSLYSGPRQEGDADGPAAFDVVLVDNGRSDMLGTSFEDMLRCIRCGACLNACPVFTSVGGQTYGSVYSGPMGSVLTPALTSVSQAAKLPNASTFCGKCEEVCPVRIPLPGMMRHWREKEFEQHYSPAGQRWGLKAWAFVARHPTLYRLASNSAQRVLRFMGGREGQVRKLPFLGAGWSQSRDLKAPEGGTFLSQYKAQKGKRA
ncbi:LutB/LldF family L-lactate oxidation iron-sulfur protein [Tepidicaulis sp. LMO-SS28]|uniref:LutB/LldF family L-lactate oxidation iron-sulfur protein n=1 Tax=Tepidicaulis sp. LMO-SS28 TaxID=3447455 RepID=UPI003EDF28C6